MEKLTINDALAIAEILTAAQSTAKVARVMEDGTIVCGTARHICANDSAAFLRSDEDVRDGLLRVTTREGWEVFWSVRELMPQANTGEFARYDW